MTYQKMINAYATLMHMSATQIPVKAARDLYSIRKAIEPLYQFCVEQERVIVNSNNGKISNGAITFGDEDLAKQAQMDLQSLYDLEANYEQSPVTINLDDLSGCNLSINDIEALDGFVNLI